MPAKASGNPSDDPSYIPNDIADNKDFQAPNPINTHLHTLYVMAMLQGTAIPIMQCKCGMYRHGIQGHMYTYCIFLQMVVSARYYVLRGHVCVAEYLKRRMAYPAQQQQVYDLCVASGGECERTDEFVAGCAGSDFKLHTWKWRR